MVSKLAQMEKGIAVAGCSDYGAIILPKTGIRPLNSGQVGVSSTVFRVSLLAAGCCVYLLYGAIVFIALEQPFEAELFADLVERRRDTVALLEAGKLTVDDLDEYTSHVIRAADRGLPIHNVADVANNVTRSNWGIGQAVFFATTIVTTVGYGHVVPLTSGGKLFCVFYGTLGIPLMLLFFSVVTLRAAAGWSRLQIHLASVIGNSEFKVHCVSLLLLSLIVASFAVLLPAAVFVALEPRWSYLDGIYYCFISVTTVGLGDFVPGESSELNSEQRAAYKLVASVYLLLGMCLVLLLVRVFGHFPEMDLSRLFCYVDCGRGQDDEKAPLTPSGSSRSIGEDMNSSVANAASH